MRVLLKLLVCALAASAFLAAAEAAEPTLVLSVGGKSVSYRADQLLQRPDALDVKIARDPSYRRPMTYRAVPLAALLRPLGMNAASDLEVRATDGFVAQLPGALVVNDDRSKAVAALAVDDPAKPWPALPGKKVSAGPFYLVWTGADVKSILVEQWPYQIAAMAETEPVERRWPQLAVDPSLPPNDPLRRGMAKFVAMCGVCHKLAGAGGAEVGPTSTARCRRPSISRPAF